MPPGAMPVTVSIVIAAYKAEACVAAAIRSALDQRDVDVEVIVVDDASPDDTAAAARAVADPRVTVLRLETNGGPGAARNAALAVARGIWIAVLDSDDLMEPDRLARLIAAGDGADILADNLRVVPARGGSHLHIPESLDGGIETIDLARYATENVMFRARHAYGYLKPLFRRAFLETHALRYDPGLRIGEDYMIVAECLARGAIFRRVRMAGYLYQTHDQSISHRLSPDQAMAMEAASRAFGSRHGPALSPAARRAVTAHGNALADAAAFTRMVESLKARRIGTFVRETIRSPRALALMRMPIMARLIGKNRPAV